MKCNGLDLNLFQFDYDLTFAAFFLNADKTIYARYGIRTSGEHADEDVHLSGLAKTMQAVVDLHSNYPSNKESLAAKQPINSLFNVPEEYSALDHFKPALNYEKNVAKSCIHCHQVRDAIRFELRMADKPLPEKLFYPFPSPSTIGLTLDPKSIATVESVEPDSPMADSGILKEDEIISINGQSIESSADFVWMLHHCEQVKWDLKVQRDNENLDLVLNFPDGWRKKSDIDWRPTSWDMRRMATGGAIFVDIESSTREKLEIVAGQTALRVKHVGKYGHHARALKAGVRVNDILIEVDGRTDLMTESAIIEYALQVKKPGESITFVLLRNGRRKKATIVLQ